MSRRPRILLVLLVAYLPINALAERFGHAVQMSQRPSGNYYVHGSFQPGVETDFLVDTGSGYVALTEKTFQQIQKLPGTRYLREIAGATATGRVVAVRIYHVANISLGEHCKLADVEVAVMPGATRDILGLSALRQAAPFAMQLNPPELLVSHCPGQEDAEPLAINRAEAKTWGQ
jgi:predicted aspartyl protease